MPLDALEMDFLGDLASDTHGVWEIFESARLHFPDRDESETFKIGAGYLSRWIERGWITVSDRPLYPSEVTTIHGLLSFVQKSGAAGTIYIEGSPSIDITETGLQALQQEG